MSRTTRGRINFSDQQTDSSEKIADFLQNMSASIQIFQNDSGSEPASRTYQDVCLQDLYDSPEFLEEQRTILREIEMNRSRTAEQSGSPQPQPQENRGRSRRSSMGIKLHCPVCLESMSSVKCCNIKMVTECGHIFCKCCIEDVCASDEAKGLEPLCPMCRGTVGDLREIHF